MLLRVWKLFSHLNVKQMPLLGHHAQKQQLFRFYLGFFTGAKHINWCLYYGNETHLNNANCCSLEHVCFSAEETKEPVESHRWGLFLFSMGIQGIHDEKFLK